MWSIVYKLYYRVWPIHDLGIVVITMRLILVLSALQGAALAQKDETHTREYCETRMSRTPATDAHTVTIHTKVEVTATKPRCLKKNKHETYKITLGPVTTTIVT